MLTHIGFGLCGSLIGALTVFIVLAVGLSRYGKRGFGLFVLLGSAIAMPHLALAAEMTSIVPPAPSAGTSLPSASLSSQIVAALLPAFLPALAALFAAGLAWLGKRLADLIAAHIHQKYLSAVLLRLNDAVSTVVLEIEQTVLADLRGPDGLTPGTAAKAKTDAVAGVKRYLGASGLKLLAGVLGLAPDAVDGLIASKVEASVAQAKMDRPVTAIPEAESGPAPAPPLAPAS